MSELQRRDYETFRSPREVAAGLEEFLSLWPDMGPIRQLLPGLPGILQEAIDLLKSMDRDPGEP